MEAKILLVDDDRAVQSVLNARLREHGYTPVFADDGISAIAAARREEPNLIILDVGLPGGDAFTVLERLRRLPSLSHVPVILISGRDIPDIRRRAEEAGAFSFFNKSADFDGLLADIARALT